MKKLLALFFLFINLIVKVLAVNEAKDEKIRPTFDEIFGKGWDKNDLEKIKMETSPLNSAEIALDEPAEDDENIDQNVEAYNYSVSTDQNLTQEYADRINQSNEEAETIEGFINENKFKEKEKREIISKFHTMRKEYKPKEKVTRKERYKIEQKISRKLGVKLKKIYKWKKEFGLNRKMKKNKNLFYEKKKREFIDRMDEIKMCQNGEKIKLAKDLGICKNTLYCWKKEFGLPVKSQIIYSDKEKKRFMKTYYKIKQRNPKISDLAIANFLNIGAATIKRWKKQFVNSVDEHSLPENAGAVQDRDSSGHPMPWSDNNLWAWNLAKKQRT